MLVAARVCAFITLGVRSAANTPRSAAATNLRFWCDSSIKPGGHLQQKSALAAASRFPFEYTLHVWLQLKFLPRMKKLLKDKAKGLSTKL